MNRSMDLNDVEFFRQLDTLNMIGQINGLPDQLLAAWEMGRKLELPDMPGIRSIVVAGMGGSAIGADLAASYATNLSPLPVFIQRDYDLPAWAQGSSTLVIVSSHSGNTEETLSAYEQARSRGCRILAVTTGGSLSRACRSAGDPVWQFEHEGQPRSAVGYSFGLIAAAMYRLGLLPDLSKDLDETLHAMRNQQTNLMPDVPVAHNPAKRMAGQLVGRWVAVFAADSLSGIARRWKGQFSEVAKAWAQFEALPEADHNTLAGLNNPENALSQMIALFLSAPSNHPRNQLRLDLTRQIFMTQGINTDTIYGRGENLLAHMWTLLHFGDYTAYYLAMAYGEDPTPVEVLTALKDEMNRAG